jgi:hypothetical protein
MSKRYDTHCGQVNQDWQAMGKRKGREEASKLREWLIFVIATETRPRTDHILARWRRLRYLERKAS